MKRELLDNGNIWQKNDGRWIGLVRYKDEFGVTQRKSFSSKKKKTLQAKINQRRETARRQCEIIIGKTGCGAARAHDLRNNRNLLRQARHNQISRTDRQFQPVMTHIPSRTTRGACFASITL